MQDRTNDIERIKELIDRAQNIAILPSEVAGADSFAAAAGLYHALKAEEKNVSFVYVGRTPKEAFGIIEPEEIEEDIYARQLHISIDYSDTPASKLSYSNEGNILKLVLSPISKDFDRTRIKTDIRGYDFDLVIVLGVQKPEDLGIVYRELREDLSNSSIINIDNTQMNIKHGDVNVIDNTSKNLSELVFKLLSKIGLVPNGKAARALLVGMTYREPQV